MQLRWLGSGLVLFTLCLAGCGGGTDETASGEGSSGVPSFAADFQPPKSGCGSFPKPLPKDPEGVLSELDQAHRTVFAGYDNYEESAIRLTGSAWSNWKPKHAPPYSIGISMPPSNDFQNELSSKLTAELQSSPMVGSVDLTTVSGSNLDIPQQYQQLSSLIQKKPDILILQSGLAAPFLRLIEQAGKEGIPTVTLLLDAPSKYAVNVDANNYLGAGTTASYAAKLLEGKGRVMYMHGFAGAPADLAEEAAWNAVVASCPDLELAEGVVQGGFSNSIAQNEMLTYLATHPEELDAVFETAEMAPGVMRAFEQSGRAMPIVPDIGLSKGSLGYWNGTRGYHNAGEGLTPLGAAGALSAVTLRMLDGQGPKLNMIIGQPPLVTDANIDEWAEPDWTLDTQGVAPGSPEALLSAKFLDDYFVHPAPLSGGSEGP